MLSEPPRTTAAEGAMDRLAAEGLARINSRLCARGLRLPEMHALLARKERLIARLDRGYAALAETRVWTRP
jgi:hypothetical protein